MMADFLANSLFFGFFLTLAAYCLAIIIYRRIPYLFPHFTAAVMVVAVILLLGADFSDYFVGARYVSFFLTPVTVALAVPLYKQINILKKHKTAILFSIFMGSAFSIISVFIVAWFINMDLELAKSLMSKSVTAAIALGIADSTGGIGSIAVIASIFTGIFGATFAGIIIKAFRITHPVAVGLAIGTTCHGAGTAKAMEIGEVEGALSSTAIVIAGLCSALLAPIVMQLVMG
ncbi:MAG: LrgB family protein [Alphaproteobacteria bacterium]|nr:LrgB family protein [Alphaproteobacteria bacterium]